MYKVYWCDTIKDRGASECMMLRDLKMINIHGFAQLEIF